MERKLKILWHSNGPNAPTGYGNQTSLFIPRLVDDVEVALSAFYGLEGQPQMFSIAREGKEPVSIMALPRGFHPYGNDVLAAHMGFTEADVCVSLIDPFAFSANIADSFRWAAWVPVDSVRVSHENQHSLQTVNHLWSMSKFGHAQLQAFVDNGHFTKGKPTLHYVPHGIDSKTYKPSNRDESRQQLHQTWLRDMTGKFIVTTVAANKGYPGRKNWPGMFMVMSEFLKAHPDAVWYIHTNTAVPEGSGDNIQLLMQDYRMNPEQVIAPPVYQYMILGYPPAYLADVYNASDVFLLMSFGEGFGLPIMEAQMSGCPVIVTDGTAMRELCLAGDKIPATAIQSLDGRQGCQWARPDNQQTVELLNKHYALWKAKDTRLRSQARDKALAYDVDTVYDAYMKPALEAIEKVCLPQTDSRRRRNREKALALTPQPSTNGTPQPTVAGKEVKQEETAA